MEVEFLSFEKAEELANMHGTPLLVISKERIKENYYSLRTSLSDVELFYAVKANPHMDIVKTIDEVGGNFDISSVGEFDLLSSLNIKTDRVLYTHPVKKKEEIEYLSKKGIDLFVFDNKYELYKIKEIVPKAKLLLRISTENPFCTVNLNFKFGAPPDEAISLIEEARSLEMQVVGLCFHVGSQSMNPFIYVDTILTCKKIYDLCALKGFKMEILDIGGGFPVKYVERVMPVGKFCEPIRNAIKNYFPNVKVIAEPGRVICGDAAVLITRVIGKSIRNNVKWYYIDDGLYNSFSGKVFDHANYRIVAKKNKNLSRCILAGPTCDSFDVISTDLLLPELEIGELLLVPSMGAYTNVSATEFNLFPKAKVISIN